MYEISEFRNVSPKIRGVLTAIFDFDGTICDSGIAASQALNDLSEEYGYPKIAPETLRNMTSQQWVQHLNIQPDKLPAFLIQLRQRVRDQLSSLSLFNGIEHVLTSLQRRGARLGILTSNSQENVRDFLRVNELDIFDLILSSDDYLGKGTVLVRLMKDQGLDPRHVIMIGDETRDIEAAREANVDSIAVTWGFHSRALLERSHPTYLCDDMIELSRAIAKRLDSL